MDEDAEEAEEAELDRRLLEDLQRFSDEVVENSAGVASLAGGVLANLMQFRDEHDPPTLFFSLIVAAARYLCECQDEDVRDFLIAFVQTRFGFLVTAGDLPEKRVLSS